MESELLQQWSAYKPQHWSLNCCNNLRVDSKNLSFPKCWRINSAKIENGMLVAKVAIFDSFSQTNFFVIEFSRCWSHMEDFCCLSKNRIWKLQEGLLKLTNDISIHRISWSSRNVCFKEISHAWMEWSMKIVVNLPFPVKIKFHKMLTVFPTCMWITILDHRNWCIWRRAVLMVIDT